MKFLLPLLIFLAFGCVTDSRLPPPPPGPFETVPGQMELSDDMILRLSHICREARRNNDRSTGAIWLCGQP